MLKLMKIYEVTNVVDMLRLQGFMGINIPKQPDEKRTAQEAL